MDFLQRHPEKLALALTLALCVAFAFWERSGPDPGGIPRVDAAGRLRTEEREVRGTPIANEVAVLRNARTGTMEEFPKRSTKKE